EPACRVPLSAIRAWARCSVVDTTETHAARPRSGEATVPTTWFVVLLLNARQRRRSVLSETAARSPWRDNQWRPCLTGDVLSAEPPATASPTRAILRLVLLLLAVAAGLWLLFEL